jgi:glycosyltransferase involved in cell wall biosynthesis
MPLTCAVVIPCYNEACRLDVDAFRRFAAGTSDISFIFVDDGSTDETAEVLNIVRNGMEDRVDVIACERNSGKAEAVRLGLNHGLDSRNAQVVGFWDADLATPLAAIYDLLGILEQSPAIDWVFGARVNLLGRHIERRTARHYLGRVFATAVSTMLRLPVYDTQCGAKLFRVSDTFRRVISDPFDSRWVFDVEMIARFIRLTGSSDALRGKIYEFPLHEWRDVAGSKIRPTDFFRAIGEVTRIQRKYL